MRVLIIGAGISGLSMALVLEKELGISPRIIEKHPKLRFEGAGIGLPANAIACLNYLGLQNKLMGIAYQVKSFTAAHSTGEILYTGSLMEAPLNQYPFVMLAREKFIKFLAKEINSKIEFNKEVIDIEFENDDEKKTATVRFNDGKEAEFDLIVAADGINSSLRSRLIAEDVRKDLGISVWRFLTDFKQENPISYSEPSGKSVFAIFPISQNQAYCYAHVMDPSFEVSKEVLLSLCRDYPKHVIGIIDSIQLEDTIFGRQSLLTRPTLSYENIAFVGDAAHATTPQLQQGAASALEDTIALTRMLKHFPNIQKAIMHYQHFRLPRINWISEYSNNPYTLAACLSKENSTLKIDSARNAVANKISGWKILLSENYFDLLDTYISENIEIK